MVTDIPCAAGRRAHLFPSAILSYCISVIQTNRQPSSPQWCECSCAGLWPEVVEQSYQSYPWFWSFWSSWWISAASRAPDCFKLKHVWITSLLLDWPWLHTSWVRSLAVTPVTCFCCVWAHVWTSAVLWTEQTAQCSFTFLSATQANLTQCVTAKHKIK